MTGPKSNDPPPVRLLVDWYLCGLLIYHHRLVYLSCGPCVGNIFSNNPLPVRLLVGWYLCWLLIYHTVSSTCRAVPVWAIHPQMTLHQSIYLLVGTASTHHATAYVSLPYQCRRHSRTRACVGLYILLVPLSRSVMKLVAMVFFV